MHPDVDIAGLLGISRTPVRETLIRLSQEGLIDVSKGRKTRVSIPDVKRAPDLYRVGGTLDGLAVEWATPKVRPPDLELMRRLNAEMDAENDPGRLVALDLQFHAVFRGLAGDVLRDLLDGIELEIGRLERLAFTDAKFRSLMRSDHHRIVDAFASGNAGAAAHEVRENGWTPWTRLR